MPISVTPWRVDQILGEAVNDRYRNAKLAQETKDNEIRNRILALQEKDLKNKIERETAFQGIVKIPHNQRR